MTILWIWVVAIGLVGAIWLLAANANIGRVIPDDPAALKRTQSLGQLIAQTQGGPVHIVFVHGMRAEGPGGAQPFMQGLSRYASVSGPADAGGFTRVSRTYFDLGPEPGATVMGQPVWPTQPDWDASRPFVDRYVFARGEATAVVVDEVNWWPLLFPLKDRFLLAREGRLSGPDRFHLELCQRDTPPFHAFLSPADFAAALMGPRVSGGGAWANAELKREIMNWGLADAVIALGPMRAYFRQAMDKAFEFAAGFGDLGLDGQEFVVISESLGSFVVMDAATSVHGDAPNARDVVGCSDHLYFFANQFALLELGRIQGLPRSLNAAAEAAAPTEHSPFEMLGLWAAMPRSRRRTANAAPRQIIAFSDPSDVLTYDVPRGSPSATVVNLYDRNEINWFNLYVNPTSAHTGHSRNQAVLKSMFKR